MNKESILRELNITLSNEEKDKQYIYKLNRTIDKVKYLRLVKSYTQEKTAELIGISERHVKRIERIIKNVP